MLPVLNMKSENRDINVVEWANITKFPLQNVVLRLMKCLFPSVSFDIFKDNYFTSFCLLTHLGVNSIQATGVRSTKISYANVLPLGANSCKKKELANFEQRTSIKKTV